MTRERSELAEKRKEQALEAVEACIRLLKDRFGAKRVILFGSVAGQSTWHGRSDIDLAVEGLAPAEFFPADSACRDLLPRGLELDLIPLENAYPEIRACILGEVEMLGDPILALKDLTAVIDEPLRARLKDHLDFRHAYGYTLEWSQLRGRPRTCRIR